MKNITNNFEAKLFQKKYKDFKGIYLETNKQYYCCDFYEIARTGYHSVYQINAEVNGEVAIITMYYNGSNWKTDNSYIPAELERRLSEIINDEFCECQITTTQQINARYRAMYLLKWCIDRLSQIVSFK